MDFKSDIRKHFGIDLSKEQLLMFETYYEKMIEYNKHTNLTTITNKDDAYYKHFYDSLTLIPYLKDGVSLCDMGSGAGFPSLPLKIVFPNLKIIIIDSSNKRIKFLETIVDALNLEDVTLVHDRIEVYGKRNFKKFDFVTARALGRLNIIVEMAIPMLKELGTFIAMKGDKGFEELEEAKNAIETLKSEVIYTNKLELPHNYGERQIFLIKKNKHIGNFPRDYKQILKKPL